MNSMEQCYNTYSIKDLERLSGVKAHTIRIWEQRYKLLEPNRTVTNIRLYNDEQLKRILNVSYLLKQGEKISKVAAMDAGTLVQQVISNHSALAQSGDLSHSIDLLLMATIELNEANFEKIISNAILRNGFEQTMLHLIYPFMEKVGVLWRVNQMNPVQEHFVSNLIRQKVIAAIDGQLVTIKKKEKYMLFLPEGEWHELGLLMAHYLLRQAGYRVYYFGQSVPMESLLAIHKSIQPENVLFFFFSSHVSSNTSAYLENLSKQWQNTKIQYSGNYEILENRPSRPNLIYLNSFSEFKLRILEQNN